MTDQPHIIVVDDDPRIRTMLRRYLTEEGFSVAEAADGTGLRQAMAERPSDLILLDLVMPGEDGLTLARYIRERSRTPIIILTGKGDVIDRVAGLEAGADDYIAKPFHLREILARIRTVLRRAHPSGETAPAAVAKEQPGKSDDTVSFPGWQLDRIKRELRRATGELVPLTTAEYELLNAFARSANRVLTRDQLMDMVKGRDWAVNDRAVDAQIVRLRKKIERDPKNPELIKTIRGAGYMFATTVTGGAAPERR